MWRADDGNFAWQHDHRFISKFDMRKANAVIDFISARGISIGMEIALSELAIFLIMNHGVKGGRI